MKFKILENSNNYTCQVIKLPFKQEIKGLNNLVNVNYQGNDCLIGKDSNESELYLFFPAECLISEAFLKYNNLYRHSGQNNDQTLKGFFEDNCRVKAIKFKGIISSGFIIPIKSLEYFLNEKEISNLKVGDEFNEINGILICQKYIKYTKENNSNKFKEEKIIEKIVDSKLVPEHMDTAHLMKNIHKLSCNDYIAVSYKLHGTSARFYNTITNKKLSLKNKIGKFLKFDINNKSYNFISASRRSIKSVDFETIQNKIHYYSEDLWTLVAKESFDGKLHNGEAIYCEIIGKDFSGAAIQKGYTYNLEKPKVYIYRISNINNQGVEIDLSYLQMKERAKELGIEICPELFYGTVGEFLINYNPETYFAIGQEEALKEIFYDNLLEKPSILDNSIIEEGFCVRIEKYPRPEIFKIKSKAFLLHEGHQLDKDEADIEEQESQI